MGQVNSPPILEPIFVGIRSGVHRGLTDLAFEKPMAISLGGSRLSRPSGGQRAVRLPRLVCGGLRFGLRAQARHWNQKSGAGCVFALVLYCLCKLFFLLFFNIGRETLNISHGTETTPKNNTAAHPERLARGLRLAAAWAFAKCCFSDLLSRQAMNGSLAQAPEQWLTVSRSLSSPCKLWTQLQCIKPDQDSRCRFQRSTKRKHPIPARANAPNLQLKATTFAFMSSCAFATAAHPASHKQKQKLPEALIKTSLGTFVGGFCRPRTKKPVRTQRACCAQE